MNSTTLGASPDSGVRGCVADQPQQRMPNQKTSAIYNRPLQICIPSLCLGVSVANPVFSKNIFFAKRTQLHPMKTAFLKIETQKRTHF